MKWQKIHKMRPNIQFWQKKERKQWWKQFWNALFCTLSESLGPECRIKHTVASLWSSSQIVAELFFLMCFAVTWYVQNQYLFECLKYCAFNVSSSLPSVSNLMIVEVIPEEEELNKPVYCTSGLNEKTELTFYNNALLSELYEY